MPLMAPQEFVETYFSPRSKPSLATVHRWLNDRQLPGRKIGKLLYIDSEAFEANGDELVAKVLRDVSRSS